VLECEVACRHAAASFDEQGRLVDDEARMRLGEAVEQLVDAARARDRALAPASVAA
jgi:hypothetical protein